MVLKKQDSKCGCKFIHFTCKRVKVYIHIFLGSTVPNPDPCVCSPIKGEPDTLYADYAC